MASERPDGGSSSSGAEMPDGGDVRATVEWHFGELIDTVSVEHPVSRRELRAALATVECEGQRREEELRSVGTAVQCEMPGTVLCLPVGVWRSVESASDVDERQAIAARDVHRRMAKTVTHCSMQADPESDLFVLCSPRHSHSR
jgi:hypothetical protein